MTDTAATRWEAALERWALPPHVVAAAPTSPWGHEIAQFEVDEAIDRDTTSARWAREVLPPLGGTVLDIGCGGGRSSLPLVPPATELIGVDQVGAMLDAYVAAAASAGVARRTVHGRWPDIAHATPVTDVVVCHHVVYNVADVAPFLGALTVKARLAVVVEMPVRHPMSAWNAGFEHFWGLERPSDPTHLDLIEVLRELGLTVEHTVGPRGALSAHAADPANMLPAARRRLCLTSDRDDELADWLRDHPPSFVDEVATIRWPGAAEGG